MTNNCEFKATLNGIVDFVVGTIPVGHLSPEQSNVVNGKTYTYLATSYDNSVPPIQTAWEAGSGAYSTVTHTLKRTTITANSDDTLVPVNFPLPPIVDVYPSTNKSLEPPPAAIVPRGYLAGLILSWVSTSFFGIAVGMATDSINANTLILASALTKLNTSWAVGSGAGCLDTGTNTINTWYHVFLIKRPDTGVIDILTSLSPTAPTLPTNYTLFRRIGSLKTNGTDGGWLRFSQNGDEFLWFNPPADISSFAIPATNTLFSLSVPPGIVTNAIGVGQISLVTSPYAVALFSPVSNTGGYSFQLAAVAGSIAGGFFNVRTNTSSQIDGFSNVAANGTLNIITYGWIDQRGRTE